MRTFAAIFVFTAFVAGIFANELDSFLMDEVDGAVPDRHPFVQCKIDAYDCLRLGKKGKVECMKEYKSCIAVLIPTIPPFVVACKNELKTCLDAASGIVAKANCFTALGKCLINKGPGAPSTAVPEVFYDDAIDPPRHPYVQCKIDAYDCLKAGEKGKLQCAKEYKNCMAQLLPTIPPFVVACKEELKKCTSDVKTLSAVGKCFVAFGKCLVNKGLATGSPPSPGKLMLDAVESGRPMTDAAQGGLLKCKKDVFKCIKDKQQSKPKCLKDYKDCLAALIPQYVRDCYAKARECYQKASKKKWSDRFQCVIDLGVCLKNGAPSAAPAL